MDRQECRAVMGKDSASRFLISATMNKVWRVLLPATSFAEYEKSFGVFRVWNQQSRNRLIALAFPRLLLENHFT